MEPNRREAYVFLPVRGALGIPKWTWDERVWVALAGGIHLRFGVIERIFFGQGLELSRFTISRFFWRGIWQALKKIDFGVMSEYFQAKCPENDWDYRSLFDRKIAGESVDIYEQSLNLREGKNA